MKAILIGTVENVNTYEGKNGFGANIIMSNLIDKRRESIQFNTQDALLAAKFEEALQEEVTVEINIIQNNFGTRLGDILSLNIN